MKTTHFFNLSGQMVEICWVHQFAMHRNRNQPSWWLFAPVSRTIHTQHSKFWHKVYFTKLESWLHQKAIDDTPTKGVFVVIAFACLCSLSPFPEHTALARLLVVPAPLVSFRRLPINNPLQSAQKMEINTDPMDDPDLISSLSISESTDHSSNSNLLFCTLAIMLASNGKKTAPWTRNGLGATAPSKKSKRTVDTPFPNGPEEEMEEVAPNLGTALQ